ncbi:MAG: WecB/TagA/CpsF family glycosyltransferase [bacterium]
MDRDSLDGYSVLGVPICDVTMDEAIALIDARLAAAKGRTTSIYFANTNALNLASLDPDYAAVWQRADLVFGDGTGVRWGSRILRGRAPRDNVNGTDLVPRMFHDLARPGRRYFLLGATPDGVARAASFARKAFAGWDLADFHHGYVHDFDPASTDALLKRIRESGADVLLVGMGNPLQERWIDAHREALGVPVALAIGGLFAYWAGDLDRAPPWMRRLGIEWLHLMLAQPRKVPRYMLGNPAFLSRVLAERLGLRRSSHAVLPERRS